MTFGTKPLPGDPKIRTELTLVTFESGFDFQRARNSNEGLDGAHVYARFYDYDGSESKANMLMTNAEYNPDNDWFQQSRVYLYVGV